MLADSSALYHAYTARDPRFDGVFFVGVTSTGIYCRPVCTAKTPREANCRFFSSAAAAEQASFRPCLRCRPELAPGNAPVDDAQRIAALIVQRIDEGMLDAGGGLEHIAQKFGWSPRQLRRIVHKELGVSPIELVQTRRLLLAKQLLTETTLSITKVAFASGFASLRRFNDAFSARYGIPPTRFRRAADDVAESTHANGTLALRLGYRPPFHWQGLLEFLAARALAGVERIENDSYARTVDLGAHRGWILVRHDASKRAVVVGLSDSLAPALPALLNRVRHLFDLSAHPEVIAARLSQDARLASEVARAPGLRVPGAFDGFELAVRAVLGQQISVKAATTIAARYVQAFGEPVATPHQELNRATPIAARVAAASVDDIASLGIIATRAATILALATELSSGRLILEPGGDPERTMAQLTAIARRRRVDRALHRHARAQMGRRISEGGCRPPPAPRCCIAARRRRAVSALAAVAKLRDDVPVARSGGERLIHELLSPCA